MSTNQEQFRVKVYELSEQLAATLTRKNADYGQPDDAFSAFRAAEQVGVTPLQSLAVRLLDKVQRVCSFHRNGRLEVAGEGVEDAYRDIAGYALIALALLEDEPAGPAGVAP